MFEIAIGADQHEVRDHWDDDGKEEEDGPRKQSFDAIRLIEPEKESREREFGSRRLRRFVDRVGSVIGVDEFQRSELR